MVVVVPVFDVIVTVGYFCLSKVTDYVHYIIRNLFRAEDSLLLECFYFL